MRATIRAILLLLGVATASVANAQVDVLLSADASSSLLGTLRSIDSDEQSVTPSGTVTVRVTLGEHPVYGTVAEYVEFLSSDIGIGDLAWSVSGTLESLDVELQGGAASVFSSPIATVPNGANSAEFPTSDLQVALSGGELSAVGAVVEHPFSVLRYLDADPRPLELAALPTIETIPLPSGAVSIEVRIPIDEKAPLDPPVIVSWLTIEGEAVFSGATPLGVPTLPHPLWLGALLALSMALVLAARGTRSAA